MKERQINFSLAALGGTKFEHDGVQYAAYRVDGVTVLLCSEKPPTLSAEFLAITPKSWALNMSKKWRDVRAEIIKQALSQSFFTVVARHNGNGYNLEAEIIEAKIGIGIQKTRCRGFNFRTIEEAKNFCRNNGITIKKETLL